MKIPKVSNGQAQILIGLAGLAVALYAVYASKSAIANGAKEVGTAINPADPKNLANKAVTGVGKVLSGNDNWTLGTWIYDVTHPNASTGFNTTSVNLRK